MTKPDPVRRGRMIWFLLFAPLYLANKLIFCVFGTQPRAHAGTDELAACLFAALIGAAIVHNLGLRMFALHRADIGGLRMSPGFWRRFHP